MWMFLVCLSLLLGAEAELLPMGAVAVIMRRHPPSGG